MFENKASVKNTSIAPDESVVQQQIPTLPKLEELTLKVAEAGKMEETLDDPTLND
jgi:hypothetical protein